MRAGPIMANRHLKMRCFRVSSSIMYLWTKVIVYLKTCRREGISCVCAYKTFALVERVALEERELLEIA